VPCSEPHNSEIFHSFDLVGDVFPGEEATSKLAQEGCVAEFDTYIEVAYAESVWDISAISPTEQVWNDVNDREVLRGVFMASGEDTVGSARGVAEEQLLQGPARTVRSSAIIIFRNLVRDQGVGLCLTPCSLNGVQRKHRKEADRNDREQ
jgi:hypothetical protein